MVTHGNTHTLIIPEVFTEDSGEYVCEAYNNYGDTDTFCRLNVHAGTNGFVFWLVLLLLSICITFLYFDFLLCILE